MLYGKYFYDNNNTYLVSNIQGSIVNLIESLIQQHFTQMKSGCFHYYHSRMNLLFQNTASTKISFDSDSDGEIQTKQVTEEKKVEKAEKKKVSIFLQ